MSERSYPATVGKYQIQGRLGSGGMGTVYLAQDPRIGRRVAIKVMHVTDPVLRSRFEREAQSAGRLKHPNIVTIYDYVEFHDDSWLVMELVDGTSLFDLIRRHESPPAPRCIELIEQVCSALAEAHRNGIVHRDVKPANLMLQPNGVMKVLDFGIARNDDAPRNDHSEIIGTLAYMSPERLAGKPSDHRFDTFAVGLVLYELLAGRHAFNAESELAIAHRIQTDSHDAFSHPDERLTEALAPVFSRALAHDPENRYESIDLLREELSGVRRDLYPVESDATVRVQPRSAGTERVDPRASVPLVPPAVLMAAQPERGVATGKRSAWLDWSTVLSVVGALTGVVSTWVAVDTWRKPADPMVEMAPTLESALALAAQGRHDDAVRQFRELRSGNPKSVLILANLCGEELQAGKPAEAEGTCREAIALEPASWLAQYNLACVLSRTGLVKEAVDALDAAFRALDATPQPGVTRGILARQARMDETLSALSGDPRFRTLVNVPE